MNVTRTKRKLRFTPGAIATLTILALTGCGFQSGPQIRLSEDELNLGNGRPEEQLEGHFLVFNDGTSPLEFSLRPSCGCTEVSPMADTVAPGGQTKVRVVLDLPATANAEKSARIAVSSNDSEQRPVAVRVSAKCTTPIRCVPSYASIRVDEEGDNANASAVLKIQDANGKPIADRSRITARSESPNFVAETRCDESGEVVLAIRLIDAGPQKRLSSRVSVTDSLSGFELFVPVSGEFVPAMRIAPSMVNLTIDRTNGVYRDRTVIVWSSEGREIGRLVSFESPEGISVRELEGPSSHGRKKLVISASDLIKPGQCGEILLEFAAERAVEVSFQATE